MNIEKGLKNSYSVLNAKAHITQINDNKYEVNIKHRKKFCPIGGKYNPDKANLIQKSICIPYTVGFLNEMDPQFKYSWEIHKCILESNENYCRYTLYLDKKD